MLVCGVVHWLVHDVVLGVVRYVVRCVARCVAHGALRVVACGVARGVVRRVVCGGVAWCTVCSMVCSGLWCLRMCLFPSVYRLFRLCLVVWCGVVLGRVVHGVMAGLEQVRFDVFVCVPDLGATGVVYTSGVCNERRVGV